MYCIIIDNLSMIDVNPHTAMYTEYTQRVTKQLHCNL